MNVAIQIHCVLQIAYIAHDETGDNFDEDQYEELRDLTGIDPANYDQIKYGVYFIDDQDQLTWEDDFATHNAAAEWARDSYPDLPIHDRTIPIPGHTRPYQHDPLTTPPAPDSRPFLQTGW